MPLYCAMVESLLTTSRLQHLRLNCPLVYGSIPESLELIAEAALCFNYPTRRPDALQIIERRADNKKAKRTNRRLRLALWQIWRRAAHVFEEYAEEEEDDLANLIKRRTELKQALQAEVDGAAASDEEDSGDDEEAGAEELNAREDVIGE